MIKYLLGTIACMCLSCNVVNPPKNEICRVVCVGDSITEGSWLDDPSEQSYPAQLQKILGSSFSIINCGMSGRCAQKDADAPYWENPGFDSIESSEPEYISVMLGTNDSKPYNWQSRDAYQRDLASMMEYFQSLKTVKKIFLALPCPAFSDSFDIDSAVIENEIVPAIRDIAATSDVILVNTFDPLRDKPQFFPDGVHPDSSGAAESARIHADSLIIHTPCGSEG